MIDCHCHLCATEFDNDLNEVVTRAQKAGVAACLVNTENKEEFLKVISLADTYKNWILPCFGVHPVQYEKSGEEFIGRSAVPKDVEGVESFLDTYHNRLIALGEVGLDYTPRFLRNEDDKQLQQAVLKTQIQLAEKYNLPLIAHSRSAGKYVISFMIENGAKNVLLHAFSGNYKSAAAGIEAGYYFSVPPSSILSDQKQSLFAKIPIEQLLLETDSPVLGPRKDERNEPANITYSCEFIAKLKNLDIETVKRITTENACKLFPKIKPLLNI